MTVAVNRDRAIQVAGQRRGINMPSRDAIRTLIALSFLTCWCADAYAQASSITAQYGYDSQSRLATVTNSDNTVRTYVYENTSFHTALTGVIDENNNRFSTWWYDSQGRAATSTEALGADSTTLTYNSDASVTETDALGAVRTFAFGRYGDRNLVTGISGSQCPTCSEPKATAYDLSGFVNSRTDYNNNLTQYTYDDTRELEVSRTEASGSGRARTTATSWNASFREPALISLYAGGTATGTPLRTSSYTYDGSGNALTKTITDPTVTPNVSRTWTYTYDSYGRVLTVKSPRTDVNSTTTYTYYTCTTGSQCGQVQTVTDALGHVTTYNTYNAFGQPLTITDANNVVTTLTYDARLRLTSRQVGTETTSFSYWPTGLLKQVTLPDGSTLVYTYDVAHRLIQINDGLGNKVVYTLDAMGNRTAENTYDVSSVLHRTHSRVINSLNELYQDINAAGTAAVTTTFGYDSNGNQTSISAPLSRNTANTYDELNRLSQVTDPNNGVTHFGYDAADNLTAVIDPRTLTTSYTYNGFGDVQTLVSPDTGTTSSTYDSGGNVATSTDARGAVSTYTYDALDRVGSVAYKIGSTTDQTITFSYDAGTNGVGHLTGASDSSHSMSWTYDALGRVTGKGLTIGTVTKSVGFGYANGDLTALVTPSGQSVTYGYNTNHQVVSITVNGTTVLSGVTYEPFGGVNGWTWGNGSTTTRSFNTDGLISQIVSAGATLGYGYDNANRISGITDFSNSTLSWSYGYDALDRLTSATTSSSTDGWSYDADGNRLTQTGTTPITFSVSSTSNQVSSTSGSLVRSYSYDAAGHAQAYGSYTFGYNNRGRMMSTNAASTNYLYNALGQMIEKSGTAGTTIFMQDESGHLIGEYDGSGKLIEETIWLGDIPVATLQFGTSALKTYYVHTDHLNTPRRISNRNTNIIVWRWDSDPFGNGAAVQNPQGTVTVTYNLRLPGQYYMAETGLNQNYFRDYDPAVGRYVESDPIGQRTYFDFSKLAGIARHRGYWNHLYNYVDNDPVLAKDPRGLLPDWLNWFLDFFNDKAPEAVTSKTIGTGLSAICITRNCGKTRSDIDLLGDCISYLSEWVKGHPELMGVIGGVTSDGAAAAVSDCAELCAKGIKKAGSCGCQKGEQ
jgi:RHS repeat-associated protein